MIYIICYIIIYILQAYDRLCAMDVYVAAYSKVNKDEVKITIHIVYKYTELLKIYILYLQCLLVLSIK